MTSSRRSFLRTMMLAAAAPAIVKAENIMKIWVPPEPEIIKGRGMSDSFFHVDESPFMGHMDDFTLEAWIQKPKATMSDISIKHLGPGQDLFAANPLPHGKWCRVSVVQKDGVKTSFIDGKEVKGDYMNLIIPRKPMNDVYVHDFKLTSDGGIRGGLPLRG